MVGDAGVQSPVTASEDVDRPLQGRSLEVRRVVGMADSKHTMAALPADRMKVIVLGMALFAVGGEAEDFSTVEVPQYGQFTPYLELAAGWNILVEVGTRLGIDLDNPLRARKVGNEFQGSVG